MKFDQIDRQLLMLLQQDCSLSNAELADKVHLSANACWRRIKRMEDDGVIERRVALLSSEALDLPVTVFVTIKTSEHNDAWLKRFAEGVIQLPEVVGFYRMSGDIDYMLKVVVRDIQDYDRVYKRLIAIVPLHDVSSMFAMECLKSSTELPLTHLRG